ncbi:GIN domain-containing protein [Sphingobacterium sp. LRF_L2]|uniref:GIN domain-containing protein n=1 Tax=Sphingobacterium sp. LRF_L2 TaxID=3369421 RepID=UPI003F5FBEF7
MNDFNNLIVQTRCKITLSHGDQPSFSIDENGEKANWVNVSILNDQLVVYTKPEYYGYLLLHDYYPQITITYKILTGLQMLDKCFVRSSEKLTLQKMGIIVREGNLDITVDAFSLDCTVIKNAYAKLSGRTIFSRVLAHQRSVYDGSELEASEGNVHVHDEAKASVWFEDELELGLFGRSKIEYRESPRMKIIRLDEGCAMKQITGADKIEI